MIQLLRETKVPCLINQLPFNIFDQNAAASGEFAGLARDGVGAITFSPLAQGLLTDRYLQGIPADSRAGTPGTCLETTAVGPSVLAKVTRLNRIAEARSQSLAQMALAWNLTFAPVASVLIGASRPEQIQANVGALANLDFEQAELEEIQATVA